jgi:hypothetical protein
MANPRVLYVDDDIMLARIPSFKRVRIKRCLGLLGRISTNLEHSFSSVKMPWFPFKNVLYMIKDWNQPK